MAIRLESTLRVVFNISLAAGMLYHASAGTIDFTPTAAFEQTPGPNAGKPIALGR